MIRLKTDPFPSNDEFELLFVAAWGEGKPDYAGKVLPRSLVHIGAFADDRLVGFVNVAWDGDVHAFLLDTSVHPEFQRQGIATMLVRRAAELAKERGAEWLHVDYDAHLEGFYRGCGFRPTGAGLIDLKSRP
ncbi:MAG: GNAT family N-acetyltransferase [Devosia sp.]